MNHAYQALMREADMIVARAQNGSITETEVHMRDHQLGEARATWTAMIDQILTDSPADLKDA